MPDKLMENTPKDPPLKRHKLKKLKELEAKLAKYEAKVEEKPEGNKPYTKEASAEKVGKCPVSSEYHYFQAKQGKSAGIMLVSSFLTGCSKYKEATVEGKADIIVAKKACAVCTDWKHERPSCLYKERNLVKKRTVTRIITQVSMAQKI